MGDLLGSPRVAPLFACSVLFARFRLRVGRSVRLARSFRKESAKGSNPDRDLPWGRSCGVRRHGQGEGGKEFTDSRRQEDTGRGGQLRTQFRSPKRRRKQLESGLARCGRYESNATGRARFRAAAVKLRRYFSAPRESFGRFRSRCLRAAGSASALKPSLRAHMSGAIIPALMHRIPSELRS